MAERLMVVGTVLAYQRLSRFVKALITLRPGLRYVLDNDSDMEEHEMATAVSHILQADPQSSPAVDVNRALYRCTAEEVRAIATQLGFDVEQSNLRTRPQQEAAIKSLRPSPAPKAPIPGLGKMKVEDLRQEMRRRGLDPTGKTGARMRLDLVGWEPATPTRPPTTEAASSVPIRTRQASGPPPIPMTPTGTMTPISMDWEAVDPREIRRQLRHFEEEERRQP